MGHRCYIEFCVGCKHHAWCTRHKEEKYMENYNSLKMKIMQTTPSVIVYPNTIPLGYEDSFFTEDEESTTKRYGKVKYPRIGAFEVYFNRKVIFSKLTGGHWPNAEAIAKKIALELDRLQRPPTQPAKRTVKKKRLQTAKTRTRSSFTSPKAIPAGKKPTVKARTRPTTAKPVPKKNKSQQSFDVDAYLRKYDPGYREQRQEVAPKPKQRSPPKRDERENVWSTEEPVQFFDYSDVTETKPRAPNWIVESSPYNPQEEKEQYELPLPQSRELIPQSPPSAIEEEKQSLRPISANPRGRPSSAKPQPPVNFDFESSGEFGAQAVKKEFSSSEDSPIVPADSQSSSDGSPYVLPESSESEESYQFKTKKPKEEAPRQMEEVQPPEVKQEPPKSIEKASETKAVKSSSRSSSSSSSSNKKAKKSISSSSSSKHKKAKKSSSSSSSSTKKKAKKSSSSSSSSTPKKAKKSSSRSSSSSHKKAKKSKSSSSSPVPVQEKQSSSSSYEPSFLNNQQVDPSPETDLYNKEDLQPDERRIPERPSDKKPIDRPTSKYSRPSDVKSPEQQLERPQSMRPSDKKPQRAAKSKTPEPVSESEENYDYDEDFDEDVDEYILDVDDEDYNDDFDNPELLNNKIEKPEFLVGNEHHDSSQSDDYWGDQYEDDDKSEEAEYSEYEDDADFEQEEAQLQSEKEEVEDYSQANEEEQEDPAYSDDDYYVDDYEQSDEQPSFEKAESSQSDYNQFLSSSDSDKEQQITKEYTITLPVGKSSNKKITYTNTSSKPVTFDLQSSDNFFMVLKQPEVHAGAGEKCKFKLKFPPVPLPKQREYILTVSSGGKAFERIKILANYTDNS